MSTAAKNRRTRRAKTVVADNGRLDEEALRKKYKKIDIVKGSLRFVEDPKSHFHNKQVVDVVCVDNGEKRTLATSDLQHYRREGALSAEGARTRRLQRIRDRRQKRAKAAKAA